MATIDDIIKGLTIQSKYLPQGMRAHIGGADHDLLYGFALEDVSVEDQAELNKAGWHWGNEYDCWYHFV